MFVPVYNQPMAITHIGEIYSAFGYQMSLLKPTARAAREGRGWILGATTAESDQRFVGKVEEDGPLR